MGTKTVDAAEATETTTEAGQTEEVTGTTTGTDAPQAAPADEAAGDDETADTGSGAPEAGADSETEDAAAGPTGVGQGAGAVVSAALGVVSLTGSWVGTVAGARENLIGQLETAQSAGVAQQIQAMYGDAWEATALWSGLFALLAAIVGVVVLVRPAFGAPGRPQAAWIKSVAWGGVALGGIGLLLAVLKYTGILLGLPSSS
ncbi:MAG TPA: hypothetical protein VFP69_08435 [Streptomyces sp.]|nr:hypothetical protein [Streptomyces sp.]